MEEIRPSDYKQQEQNRQQKQRLCSGFAAHQKDHIQAGFLPPDSSSRYGRLTMNQQTATTITTTITAITPITKRYSALIENG
jgi:hypothetical protein